MPPAMANPSSRSEKRSPSTTTASTASPGSLFLRQISTPVSAARAQISSTLPASTRRNGPPWRIFPARLRRWTPMSPRCRRHWWKRVPRNCLLFAGPFLISCRWLLHQEPESVFTARWVLDPRRCPKRTLILRLVHCIVLILKFLLFGCWENCVNTFKFVFLLFFHFYFYFNYLFSFLFFCLLVVSWLLKNGEDSRFTYRSSVKILGLWIISCVILFGCMISLGGSKWWKRNSRFKFWVSLVFPRFLRTLAAHILLWY